MKAKLTLYILFLFIIEISAQINPIRFQHLNAKDGLSQGHVLSMMQDSDGYIWAGTYHGLNRYNGYSIDVFTADKNNSNSLFINVVFSLYEDRDGLIWIGTWGVDIFDRENETYTHIPAYEGENHLSAGEVSAFAQDKDGNMWIATQGGGLNKYDYITHKITHYRSNLESRKSLNSDFINDILIDKNEKLWIATENGGLSVMTLHDESIVTYRHSKNEQFSLPSDKISSLFEDENGVIWIGDDDGNLLQFDENKNQFKRIKLYQDINKHKKARIVAIEKDWEGNLLLATNGAGLIEYNVLNKKSSFNTHNSNNPESIVSNELRSLLIDKNNTIFVGSFGRGISKYSPFNRKFDVHSISVAGEENYDINSFTNAIEDSKGNLITGTYNGFVVFDKNDWSYTHYLPGNSYEDNKILTLGLAPDSTIWLSSMKSLHRYDKYFNKISSYVFDKDLKDHSIYTIEFDYLNNLWIGLFTKGLIKISESEWRDRSKKDLNYKIYNLDYNDSTSISGDQNWEVYSDSDSNLWIGNVAGLCQYNYDKDNFIRYFDQATVKTIKIDSKNKLWLGTIGEGLFSYDISDREQKRYTVADGLSHSFIYGMIMDKRDNLWISTEAGLSKFNIETENFRTYDIRDGLPSDHFDDKSDAQLSDGKIYMGTINGFVLFRPEDIVDDTSKAKVVLSSIKINHKTLEYYPQVDSDSIKNIRIDQVKEIELSFDQKNLSLEFAALHFSAPHKIKYLYKLEGYDNKWISADANIRAAHYANLEGGEYAFLVKATNGDGKWNEEPLRIKITVHPPFYKTTWFILFILISSVLILYLLFKWRITKEIKQKQILAKKVKIRTAEISNKNKLLEQTADDLKSLNIKLEDRQKHIEEQSEELEAQRDTLAIQRDELVTINATKDKLFSIIAHDLKNPFNVIMGYCDLLIDQYESWDDEKKLHFLNLLKDSTNSAFSLLENLLHWSRNQMSTTSFIPVKTNVHNLIETVIHEVESFAKKKDIEIVNETEDNNLIVYADVNMLSLIIRNLLSNAVKFSKKGDKVYILATSENKNFVRFKVQDNGTGMSNESIKNLFQLDKSKSKLGTLGEKGTGLGLILCQDFIENHGGKIWAESELTKGTTFYFNIPSIDISKNNIE